MRCTRTLLIAKQYLLSLFPLVLVSVVGGCNKVAQPPENVSGPAASTSPADAPPSIRSRVDDLQHKIDQWKKHRDKLSGLLAKAKKDKAGILNELDALSENAKSPKRAVLGDELQDLIHQEATYTQKLGEYDLAILKSESQLRRIERRLAAEDAGLADEELSELTRTVLSTDEVLVAERPVSDVSAAIETQETVAKQLAAFRAEKAKQEEEHRQEEKRQQDEAKRKEQEAKRQEDFRRKEEMKQSEELLRLAEKAREEQKLQEEKNRLAEIARQKEMEARRAIIDVTIAPPNAELSVNGERISITGSGATRTLTIDNPSGEYRVAAWLDGYKPFSKRITPTAGQSEKLSVSLELAEADEGHEKPAKPENNVQDVEDFKVGNGSVKMTTTVVRDGQVTFIFRASGFGANYSAYDLWLSNSAKVWESKIRKVGQGFGIWEFKLKSDRVVKGARVTEVLGKRKDQ